MRLLPLIFFASGFAGLIYESIWSHYLKLFLGHAAYAQTLVLAIFMGGMAVGAALTARHTANLRNPLRTYAAVEGVIGLCALVFHPLFVGATDGFYDFAATTGLAGAAFGAAKWGLAVALILPQSILLGATFPLFAAAATRLQPAHEGRSIATLYFANSLGGAVGVLGSGFLLIPALGLPGTSAAAGTINLLIAALTAAITAPRPLRETSPGTPSGAGRDPMVGLMLAVSFITGASSFIYEVGWIRMLSLVLGSATHSFELMLSSMILGLALGGWWVRKRVDTSANPGILLGYVQIAMGLAAVATVPLHALTFDLVAHAMNTLPRTEEGYAVLNLVRYGIASLIMLPAAFCAGMTLPLATRILFSRTSQGERAIGRIYSANTVGAICGIAFAMHIGFPVLGLNYLVASGALIDVLLGGALLITFAGRARARQMLAATLACVAGTAIGATSFNPQRLASGVFRTGKSSAEGNVIDLRHGKTASISVETTASMVTIRTNGKPDASVALDPKAGYVMDEVTMTLIGAIPLLLHDSPRHVANIGFGSGMTAATLLDDPRIARLDTIEIEPAMVRMAKHFDNVNRRVYDDPRSHIHIDDAKSFFASAGGRTYDLIVSEPSNPWVSGVSGLFSVEFYRHVKRYLKDDGLFAQWLQIYELHPDRAASVIKAIAESFDDYLVVALDHGDVLIVARPKGRISLDADAFEHLSPALHERLQRIAVRNPADIIYRLFGSKALLQPWLAASPPPANSDFAPYLDSHADRDRFVNDNWLEVFQLGLGAYPLAEMLGMRPPFPTPSCLTINSHFGANEPPTLERLAGSAATEGRISGACPPPRALSAAQLTAGSGIIDACRNPPLHDQGYAAVGLARILPLFSPQEGRQILAALQDSACLGGAGAGPTAWPALLAELVERNPQGLGQAAAALLDGGHGATPIRAHYLLAMAMLGHVGAGEAERARELWYTHSPTILAKHPRSLVLEVLRDHAFKPPENLRP